MREGADRWSPEMTIFVGCRFAERRIYGKIEKRNAIFERGSSNGT
jgi:hypothetical protein